MGNANYAIRVSAFFAALFLIYGVHLPYLPVWLEWRGLGPTQIGIVTALPFFVRLVATPAVAFYADRHDKHARTILGLMWVSLVAALVLAGVEGFWPILLAAVVMAVSFTTVMPLTETIAIGGVRRGMDYGRMRLWGSLTFIVASFVGGAAVDWAGPAAGIWLIVAGCAVTVLTAYVLPGQSKSGAFSEEVDTGSSQNMRPNQKAGVFSEEVDTGSSQKMRPNQKVKALIRFHRVETRARHSRSRLSVRAQVGALEPPPAPVQPKRGIDRATVARLLTNPLFVTFLVAIGTVQAAHATFYTFGAIHWQAGGLTSAWVGTLWAIGVLTEVSLFAVSGWAVAVFGPVGLMLMGAGAAVVRWLAMSTDPTLAWLVPLQVLHGLTYGASHLGAIHFIGRAVPLTASGTAQAFYATIAMGVLQGAAVLLSGVLYKAYGGGAYLAMAGLAAIGLIAALRLHRSWNGGELWDVGDR